MRYVIIRDDDTNALTPVECLERLYRPFLDCGLPVNLATIPEVALDTTLPSGEPEGFLMARNGQTSRTLSIGSNAGLVRYLRDNSGYHIIQHGLHHDYFEFDRDSAGEIARRLERGTELLIEAGFERPRTFVAPYDKLSRPALREVARRFQVLSTGWFELRRLPLAWWPRYFIKKARAVPHWRVGDTVLLSHPGCLLSYQRNYDTMLDEVIRSVQSRRLTVLVTHWWEYFRGNKPDEAFIASLHKTAEYLSKNPEIKVISFSELARGPVPLN
jgi:hypothetical protein